MYRGRVHEPDACTLTDGDYLKRVKSSHGIIFAAYHRQQLLALFTLRVLIPDVHPRRYSLTVFFLGNQLVKLSYSKKTTTETLIQPENSPEIGFMGETVQEGQNNNEKILEMHKQGKSHIECSRRKFFKLNFSASDSSCRQE